MMKTAPLRTLTQDTSEAGIAACILQVKGVKGNGKKLLPYLPLRHPLYQERSANAVIRIRSFIFAAFAHTGLPDEALPYVLEVLESERSAWLVAAAAMALRGRHVPEPEWAHLLQQAFRNVKFVDDAVSFDDYTPRWPLANQTTALQEIVKTLQWMGPGAATVTAYFREQGDDVRVSDQVKAQIRVALLALETDAELESDGCCRPLFFGRRSRDPGRRKILPRAVAQLEMEDHAGARIEYGDFFFGAPAAVALFYTRCDNPNKCSLTVTRLGQLQKQLTAAGLAGRVKTAAITYDPFYDSSARLQAYCEDRDMGLDEMNRAFRIEAGMPDLLCHLDSGVNYIGSVVNQHTIELFLLDRFGRIRGRVQQRQWQPTEVVAALKKLAGPEAATEARRGSLSTLLSPIFSLLFLVSPKCPFCWAAYLSVLGLNNMAWLQWTGWLPPLFAGLLVANLFSLYRGTVRNGWLPFFLCLLGALSIACSLLFGPAPGLNLAGLGFSVAGAVLNSLPYPAYRRLLRAIGWRPSRAGQVGDHFPTCASERQPVPVTGT